MEESQAKELCLSLITADSEEKVIDLLREARYWDHPAVWRFYGDRETNFNTIGNQQSRPDAALVEKLVNSVDARLMNECFVRGLDPEGPEAPQSVREGVALFFEHNSNPNSTIAGRISDWPDARRREIGRGITLAATGFMPREGNPCFTISDCGEGQTPGKMPLTLLSLDRSNKLRVPFVQGKFNMGGTGVLQFCGRHNLQLVVSRRNPSILERVGIEQDSDSDWGFSVVRREDPGAGRRTSAYTYLAPRNADRSPGRGSLLRFSAEKVPVFPDGREPYARESSWGTLIKLYEYSAAGYRSHILMKDGLLRRVDLLLPEVALPIRFYECRSGYKGHGGSPENTLTGLGVRLNDDRNENLELGFPSSCPMSAGGEQMTATVYAFKRDRADTYRQNEGVIFILNGQTHGHLTTDFFRRRNVGLSYLADSVLVTVDCSRFSGRAREDLFMNSRDRLRAPELRHQIESALEDVLRHHEGLRELRERRRREEIESKLSDSKPLEDVLKSVLEHSPTLAKLFLLGTRATNPFKTSQVQQTTKPFEGKPFPTYFKFKGKDYGVELERECHINMRLRIGFETDAANDYFSRETDPGEFALHLVLDGVNAAVPDYSLNLQNGVATLSAKLPEGANVADALRYLAVVTDCSRTEPFENRFVVRVKEEATSSGNRGKRHTPPGEKEGGDREIPSGITLPKIIEVPETDWSKHTPAFDQYTALRIRHAGEAQEPGTSENEGGPNVYDFFVNVDNLYLKSELKTGGEEVELKKARFINGLALVGLAVLYDEEQSKTNSEREIDSRDAGVEEPNIEDRIEGFSRAVAPVLLPMIESLSALEADVAASVGATGDAV